MNTRVARPRQGLTAVEVMVAVVLVGLGLIPVLSMMRASGREAGFSEGHVLVQARALSLLDAQEALGFDALEPLAEEENELPLPATAPAAPALTRMADGARYVERLTFRKVASGLGVLAVRIEWVLGTDQRGGKPHVFRAFRMLARPDASWTAAMPLPVTEPAVAD